MMTETVMTYAKKNEKKNGISSFHNNQINDSQYFSSPADRILFLQRTIGNQAVQRLIRSGTFQAKFNGSNGDLASNTVMKMPGQKKTGSTETLENEANKVAEKVVGHKISQSEISNSSKKDMMGGSSNQVHSQISHKVGQELGHDFTGVRFHTNESAASRARSERALAVTEGNNIYFGKGFYRPDHPLGQALIAHELTHVAQQRLALSTKSEKSPNTLQDYFHSIEKYGFSDPKLHRKYINDFHSKYPDAVLDAQKESLTDQFSMEGVTPAPASMRLQRCIAGCSRCGSPPSPTRGQQSRTRATELVSTDDAVKAQTDRLRSALREIRQGTGLQYHRNRTPNIINELADNILHLTPAQKTSLRNDFEWFLEHGPPGVADRASDTIWNTRTERFFQGIRSPLSALEERYPRSQMTFWIKNTPTQIFDLMHEIGNANIPPAFLYAAASKEGMVDIYIRGQVANPAQPDRLNDTELRTISVDRPVSGFQALGLDTFFTELGYTNQPLRTFFPTGFDESQLTEVSRVNEFGTPVRAADAPNLRTGLQAMISILSRRRALFLEDARNLGYPQPTNEEIVYWTYVYYNTGPGDRAHPNAQGDGGYQTLYRHRPAHPDNSARRNLSDWINRGEYPNAIKMYQSYRMIVESGILPGY